MTHRIATHYGEVFWTSQGNQPLPQHIVDRFKGKVMAITGYEQDQVQKHIPSVVPTCPQVMVVPTGKPGLNPEQDVSVPINWYGSPSSLSESPTCFTGLTIIITWRG